MLKSYLLTPGPTQVPEQILSTFSKPILHHRTPQFKAIMAHVQKGLRYLFQTEQDVITLCSSGTGAMEAALSNVFSKGDVVLVLNAGKFGARWSKLAKTYGLTVHEIKSTPGQSIHAAEVESFLKTHPQTRGVLFQASETSTGVALPTADICRVIKNYPQCLSVVDAITALGVMDLPMDAWGIDVLITGSQKALMLPPGLACLALSPRAWDAVAQSDLPKFYFDLTKERDNQRKGQTAWTPAVGLIIGLQQALDMIQTETLPEVFARHQRCAQATRAGVKALGLQLFAQELPSPAVTSVAVPSTIADGRLIPKTMRDTLGVSIAGGQDELEGRIFRLTHLGYVDCFDVLTGLGALELALRQLGYNEFDWGAGTGAVLKEYSQFLKR